MSNPPAKKSVMPEAEVAIDLAMVRGLIATQAPQWAHEEISYLATGWDNEVYRLGDSLLIRLPRRQMGEGIGVKERRWLPQLAKDTGVDIGLAIFEGQPTDSYPFTFSICRYVPGNSAAQLKRQDRDEYAEVFSELLRALHQPASSPEPRSEFRGCALTLVDARTHEQISNLDAALQADALAIWQDALEAENYEDAPVWLHGDPHPYNTVVGHELPHPSVCLVDYGDLCVGDPASDLGMFWMHFTPVGISRAFESYGIEAGSPTWKRARGWGLRYAMLTADLGADDLLGIVGRESLGVLLGSSDRKLSSSN
ncbi:aminoglycoside phosphotransferase family protein [Arthrobacter sp. S41]|uniref:aminoglycoside phosphotransferase family protein n=1 Tax=Arthrobacter sp. S41 TaxID=2509721 RepID=UPI001035E785|nr:aminoglycoside phosphotransferase family protein [Arthrobacter sp. S41]TAP25781.1 aminoglycoside phosphotransferase family protein [Arthrobacter sp. S41]